MKNIFIFLLFLHFSFHKSQGLAIQWQKYIGGSQQEHVNAMKKTSDGGFIFAGSTQSIYIGNIYMTHHGSTSVPDYWLLKTDSNGNIQWSKNFGGTSEDRAYDVQQTADGGYIVVGASGSNNGDVNDHIGDAGPSDCWVIKVDANGNIQWKKSYGSIFGDYGNSVILTNDGNYLIVGGSYYLSDHHGTPSTPDGWILKIDPSGNIIWSKSLGGTFSDSFASGKQTPDGGYILVASSYSNDGDVGIGHHGTTYSSDIWVVKTDGSGNIQWQKSFGGADNEIPTSIELTPDGGFVIAGESSSSDGDVSGHFGAPTIYPYPDYWIVKLDGLGNIQWEKSFGGNSYDYATLAKPTSDGGYLVAGHTASTDGQVLERFGSIFNYDYWILKLNNLGDIVWQKTLGGENYDYATDIYPNNNGYIVAGSSSSNSVNVFDLLLYQIGPETLGTEDLINKSSVAFYPNPVKNMLYFSEELIQVQLYSIDGRFIKSFPSTKSIDFSSLSSGEYLIKAKTKQQQDVSKKFLKN